MINRRNFSAALLSIPVCLSASEAFSRGRHREIISLLQYPPVKPLGDRLPGQPARKAPAASAGAIRRADQIIATLPTGPRPIDIAQALVDRFYDKEPSLISQLPAPAARNPLIGRFFQDTATPNERDIIAWCAAFANFCIHRTGMTGSRSAWSQSFLADGFEKTDKPEMGDLAVFTCFSPSTGQNMHLGHVAFFKEQLDETRIRVVGGNQSSDDHSSIISEAAMPTTDRAVKRHLPDGTYVPAIMRLNTYVRLA